MDTVNRLPRPSRAAVFAVEDTTAQVCWSGLPEGTVVEAGDAVAVVPAGGRPGAAPLEGLPPATTLDLTLEGPNGRRRLAGRFTTLAPPPGQQLCRFATVNDIHIGERHFGLLRTMRHRTPEGEGYPLVCARAAVQEAVEWGAELLLVKGDITWSGRAFQWEEAAKLLAAVPVPLMAVLGNHDVGPRAVDGRELLAAQGITVPEDPWSRDLPGLRVVLAHTAVPRKSRGQVLPEQRRRVADLVGSAPGPAFLGMHHYPQRFRLPLIYPAGIPGNQARALLDAVAGANPATLVSSGHSHRNRRHFHGPLVVTEIGATMHYPGTWAGYAVHEGGIRQVVRRVAAPEAVEWTERSRRALLGLWGRWAPGSLDQRCFSHTWPNGGG